MANPSRAFSSPTYGQIESGRPGTRSLLSLTLPGDLDEVGRSIQPQRLRKSRGVTVSGEDLRTLDPCFCQDDRIEQAGLAKPFVSGFAFQLQVRLARGERDLPVDAERL